MGQYFYINEEKMVEQFERMNTTLSNMLEFAFLHEDMVNTIESLMTKWSEETLPLVEQKKEWEELSEEDKDNYSDFEDFLGYNWWIDIFDTLEPEMQKKMLNRFRETIMVCLRSNTYDEEEILSMIESD